MQTTVTATPAAGLPGQQFGIGYVLDIASGPAHETIPFGVLVERRTDGKLQVYRGGRLLGVAMYKPARETVLTTNGSYLAGDQVAVMRKGRVWVATSSTAAFVALTAPNVHAASDDSNPTAAAKRGKFTADATSATVGAEILAIASGVLAWRAHTGAEGLALLELNVP